MQYGNQNHQPVGPSMYQQGPVNMNRPTGQVMNGSES